MAPLNLDVNVQMPMIPQRDSVAFLLIPYRTPIGVKTLTGTPLAEASARGSLVPQAVGLGTLCTRSMTGDRYGEKRGNPSRRSGPCKIVCKASIGVLQPNLPGTSLFDAKFFRCSAGQVDDSVVSVGTAIVDTYIN